VSSDEDGFTNRRQKIDLFEIDAFTPEEILDNFDDGF
jgi:hypothetical protein